MRVNKFIAWDEENKTMLPSVDLSGPRSTYDWLGMGDYKILQFTGKKDIKGVEIYEDDILLIDTAITGSEGLSPGFVFTDLYVRVVWDEKMSIWSFNLDGNYSSYYDAHDDRAKFTFRNQVRAMMFDEETAKIVGNFNRNPELLK